MRLKTLVPTLLCSAVLSTSVYADGLLEALSGTIDTPQVICKDKVYHIYLLSEIKGPEDYLEEYKLLSSAKEGDVVYLHLSGPGGQGDGLIYLVNAINNSKAKVVSVMDGSVASADAVLAVMNKDYIINDDVQVLFHNISISGMTNELCRESAGSDRGLSKYEKCMEDMPKYIEFYNSVINRYVHPLLTIKERKLYDEGHDIILNSKEIKERLDQRK